MFETKKTLIVVYRDELLVNQLRKMVEAHDDSEQGVVGTRDNSINIVSWTEKVWLGHKKAGNVKDKILFLDEIRDTDKLIPVIDIKFEEFGVRFGWAGNQAVLYVNPKALADRNAYDAFLERLSDFSPPEILKASKNNRADTESLCAENESTDSEERKKPKILRAAQKALSSGAEAIGKAGSQVAVKSEAVFRNRGLMKRQMLFYGVIRLYLDWLEAFMNE